MVKAPPPHQYFKNIVPHWTECFSTNAETRGWVFVNNLPYFQEIKNRKDLTADKLEALEAIVMDSAKAQAIIDAGKMSMGMDISPVDLINIDMFAARVIGLIEYRKVE